MELKEGMYVRTKYGITQYKEYEINNCGLISKILCMPVKYSNEGVFANIEDIIGEPSFNLIDLIEVGDYVNGSKVQEIRKNYIEIEEYSGLNNDEPCIVKSEDIKSIVTKEQFKSMEYRLGDK